ncbi:hypothetical protein CEXT_706431 [Caerostris extrusa]|uniref:Uncharacterized protein n=1 Tax=Caerostris extrusa TaxID=172846 RepID=A0AAV4QEF8_CAEEX|nr:hypothetical protein CEXT_706431 [Caerostris extrusa]
MAFAGRRYKVCLLLQWCPRNGETLTGRNLYGNAVVSDGQKERPRGNICPRTSVARTRKKKELFPPDKWGSERGLSIIIDIELYGWKWFLKMAILFGFPMVFQVLFNCKR